MSREKAGAYHEAQKRIQETIKDEEKNRLDDIQEHFEKSKDELHTKNKFDIFSLRHRISIGQSLSSLRNELQQALSQGEISQEQYSESIQTLEIQHEEIEKQTQKENTLFTPEEIPFGKSQIAQKLENQRIGENIGADIVGFLYGFVFQGSAILVILAWKILTDIIFLPRDIIHLIHQK